VLGSKEPRRLDVGEGDNTRTSIQTKARLGYDDEVYEEGAYEEGAYAEGASGGSVYEEGASGEAFTRNPWMREGGKPTG